jgi:hypothetical protein
MQRNDLDQEPDDRDELHPDNGLEEHPVPGIKYEPEPDAENIMPAEDQPGTL